ncbi:cupin domain-containing protein [Jeongeupia wiesaeckerbachi]|uniref:cupin domain-containing protein n=1 Tax=Jeongeupia wiesaeckerbachi TaxID=3051218 RepID=UPI003D80A22B
MIDPIGMNGGAMMAYRKIQLNDSVTMQVIEFTEQMMSARFWFAGKGFDGTHQHSNEEVNVVLNGEFMATNGSEQYPAHPGQVVQVAPNTEHNMECLTPTGEMISVWTPVRQDLIKYALTEEM